MLDDAYLHWLDQCGFSDSARTLLTDIRRSPLVRRTASGRGNIHGQYPSRKMRRTIQFESHTELGATELQTLIDHWPLFFYRGCLRCFGVLKDWLIRTVSAALRKGDAMLTLERVREQELVEASLADMAAGRTTGGAYQRCLFTVGQFTSNGEQREGSRSDR